jgi:hypothetical protein
VTTGPVSAASFSRRPTCTDSDRPARSSRTLRPGFSGRRRLRNQRVVAERCSRVPMDARHTKNGAATNKGRSCTRHTRRRRTSPETQGERH